MSCLKKKSVMFGVLNILYISKNGNLVKKIFFSLLFQTLVIMSTSSMLPPPNQDLESLCYLETM